MILVIIKHLKELFRDLYNKILSINETEKKQDEFDGLLGALSTYPAKMQRRKHILIQRTSS